MVSFPLFFGVFYICSHLCDAAPSRPEVLNQESVEEATLNQGWYLSRDLEPPFKTDQIETDRVIYLAEPYAGEDSADKEDESHTISSYDVPAIPPRPIYTEKVVVY